MAHLEALTQPDPSRLSTQSPQPSLPLYGIRDEEMTKPCVVLVDWTVDEARAVAQEPEERLGETPDETLELLPDEDVHEMVDDELESDAFYNALAPRWHGVGRKPGVVALGVILTSCLVIGLVALFAPSDAQAGASGATDIALR
jgi:hypothetical protein